MTSAQAHRRWLSHAGTSAILTGWLAMVVGAWWLPPGMAGQTPLSIRAWSLAVGVLLLVWALALFATRRKAFDPTVLGALLAALAFAASVVVAALTVADQSSRGWVGAGAGAALVGSVAGVIGSILILTSVRRIPGPPPRSRVASAAAAAAGALAVAVAVTGTLVWVPKAGLTASTAAVTDPPALAGDLAGEAWRADMPGRLRQVLAAGAGVAGRLDDGVIALDGRTGEARWSYRREGAATSGMRISPDGRTLILEWSRGAVDADDPYPDGELVFLDTMTGRELHRQPSPSISTSRLSITLSQESVARVADTLDRVTGYSLRTGERLPTIVGLR